MRKLIAILSIITIVALAIMCTQANDKKKVKGTSEAAFIVPDTSLIPKDKFGDLVRYGRELMVNTAYYLGPNGIAGNYTGNRMNCTNCHQDAGTKPFSMNLVMTHDRYPQYRAREAKVLTLAERVNNCVMRPHNGRPLPLDSKEMAAFLSYFRWINSQVPEGMMEIKGEKNLEIEFPDVAADPARGAIVYANHCQRCHGANGEGLIVPGQASYTYPLLWGDSAYQPGSSMHRIIKQAQWLKANMPFDSARWDKPVLTDQQALDVAAFVNDDRIHKRPNPETVDYPIDREKPIDVGKPPFFDTFSAEQHKFGPYKPIIEYWKSKGLKPVY